MTSASGEADDLIFCNEGDEPEPDHGSAALDPWKILIVDDDPEVHAITRVVLSDVTFDDRPLVFYSAHSGAEARTQAMAHPDLAAVLLDVVMETDDAGLRVVRFIRDELKNRQVRIILRTGQPGQAPERQVIVTYDINDYKAKSELTAQKLFTATIAALRSYQHISLVERNRRDLERIADVSARLLEERSLTRYLDRALVEFEALFNPADGLCLGARGGGLGRLDGEPMVMAGTGRFRGLVGTALAECLPASLAQTAEGRFFTPATPIGPDDTVVALGMSEHARLVLVAPNHRSLDETDRRLLEIFIAKVAAGFDKVFLLDQLARAQKATLYALGKLAEYKDEVTGDHVRRVERWSELIARELQTRGEFPALIDEPLCEQM